MRSKRILLISILVLVALGAGIAYLNGYLGDPITRAKSKLEGTWRKGNESFTIAWATPSYSQVLQRQVGQDGDSEIPFPTVCSYRQKGPSVSVRACESGDTYCQHEGGKISNLVVSYGITEVELDESAENPPACKVFIQRTEKTISERGLGYSFPFRFVSDNEILQWGRDTYKKD